MFNLDQAIAEWRRLMLAAGIKTPVPLNELESHLREDVEMQVRSGVNAQQAFESAVQRIGQAGALTGEFAKVRDTKRTRRLIDFLGIGFLALIVWLSAFTFSRMEWGPGGQAVAFAAVAFTLVVACGWRYAVPLLPVLPSKRKRTVVSVACAVSGFLCAAVFTNFILPHFERNLDGQIPAIGFWAVFPIAVFFGLACGIDEAARRETGRVGA